MAGIGTQPEQDWDPVWNTYVSVRDADATAATVEGAGGQVVLAPFDIGAAGRMAVFADPTGASEGFFVVGRSLYALDRA